MLQNNAIVKVTRDRDGRDFGVMRTRTGGGKGGENTRVRPGGMAKSVALPGTSDFEDVTTARLLEFEKDSGLIQEAWDSHGERFTITEQPTDARGKAGFHRPTGWSGLLNASTPSDYDADSNDPKTLEMVFTVDTGS